MEKNIGFIGAGKMAEGLIKGIIESKISRPENIHAADPAAERRRLVGEIIGENVYPDNSCVMERCRIVIIAVKPQKLRGVAEEISSGISDRHLIISIAPGITLDQLSEMTGAGKVIRAMPNTPALVGRGATAFCAGEGVSEKESQIAFELFSAVGVCIQVDEVLMDAVTGLSGSGPAYAFMAIQALSDGGVKMGLSRGDATVLAAQTLQGAAELVLTSGENPESLKDSVTTPGGTTIEGVHALERAGLRNAMISAVEAATNKSKALGQKNN